MHEFKGHVDNVRKEAIQYLQEQGFFNVNSSASSLSNEIAPIFARDRFIGVSQNMYESMRPALQLASRFVGDERVLDYFWHQMRSRTLPSQTFVGDAPPPLIYVSNYRLVEKSALMAEWREKLDNLTSVLTWKVQESDRTPTDMDLGLTFAFDELRTTFSDRTTNNKTYNEILRLCNWREADRSAKNLGPQFLLAHVLLHELAHCLDKFPTFTCNDPRGLSMEAFAS
ncbi:hypothetical protein J4E86_004913 [Alternaria arbusti]|uniref:uncharacterized protein n=1 Tax=Alternaria arbusti TaxID=232088 RepID=UPI00221FFFAB|nr:uncharacterized protein J4E86_004913 [Alternaria arbusti]KAI4957774.1 hypothetical protein J4E86_004913 [Alternaria arbusti]